jgi:hypothetical protein
MSEALPTPLASTVNGFDGTKLTVNTGATYTIEKADGTVLLSIDDDKKVTMTGDIDVAGDVTVDGEFAPEGFRKKKTFPSWRYVF